MNSKLQALMNLAALVEDPPSTKNQPCVPLPDLAGQHIVVLDRGFVYVGEVSIQGDFLLIRNAKNIRRWGTTRGLGELVNGPTEKTVLDPVGEVKAPLNSLIHLIPCSGF